jgi:hypothetical protein
MERVWTSRLRWRLRGAWMWPAFAALTILDGVLLHARPIAGDAMGLFGGVLLASLFNLVAVAVLAPMAGTLLRRRRRDLPAVVATDYAGTALLVAVTLALIVAGALHRPAIQQREQEFARQAAAVRAYVLSQAPAVYRRHLAAADTIRVGSGLFRTCVPGNDPRRALCLFVSTDQSPPGVRLDPNRQTNRGFVGR